MFIIKSTAKLKNKESFELSSKVISVVSKKLEKVKDFKINQKVTMNVLPIDVMIEVPKDYYLTEKEINDKNNYCKKVSNYYVYACSNGYVYNSQRKRKNFGNKNAWGYLTYQVNGKTTTMNNFLYSALVEPVKGDMVIHHKDHNKENNNLKNLDMITRADNLRERFENNPNLGSEMFEEMNKNYILDTSNNTLYKNKAELCRAIDGLSSACDRVLDGTWKSYKAHTFRYLTDFEMEKLQEHFIFNGNQKKVKLSQLTFYICKRYKQWKN